MTFPHMIGLLLAFAGMAGCGLASALMANKELDEVNRLLPPERRFGWLGWHAGKSMDFAKESRALGVRQRYRRWRVTLAVAGLAFTIAFAWLIP